MSVYRPIPTRDAVPPTPPVIERGELQRDRGELPPALWGLWFVFGFALAAACIWVEHARSVAIERGEVTR